MPRLNILRPHRRAHSSQASTTNPATPVPSTPASPPLSSSPPPAPATASVVLPPLNVGSPDFLGLPDQWLEPSPSGPTPAPPSTATATPAPSSTGFFSRTSTPHTVMTLEVSPKQTPAPQALRPRSMTPTSGHSSAMLALTALGVGGQSHASDKSEKAKESRTKLGRLNPMSLLRRRSSQRDLVLEKDRLRGLPDNFDPKIIYGTRHPDWSSHSNREGYRRSLSPVPVGPDSPGLPTQAIGKQLKVSSGKGIDARIGLAISPEQLRNMPLHQAEKPLPPSPPSKNPPPPPSPPKTVTLDVASQTDMEAAAVTPIIPSILVLSQSPSGYSPVEEVDTPTVESGRRGVTLVDHPLSLPHYQIMSTSRFSFEGSSKGPSAAASIKEYDGDKDNENDDRSSFGDGSFQFDLDDNDECYGEESYEDDGFARANEGLFAQENTHISDQYSALQAAVEAMSLGAANGQQGIEMSLSEEVAAQQDNGGYATGQGQLPHMDPQTSDAGARGPREISLSSGKRLGNPRGLDLSDDSDLDFIDNEQELAGYEDDDDELYYDDGMFSETLMAEVEPQAPMIYQPADETTPVSPPPEDESTENIDPYYFIPTDENFPDTNRLSMATTGISSGMIPQDGSMETQPETETQTFPPFINPVGGGLGYTPQQHQFYAPSVNGTMLNGHALSSLTYSLEQYQRQQLQSLGGAPQSPSEGYDSDINERPNFENDIDFGFDFDDRDGEDDADMVAAANAEVLASDSEGFYGSEFGFYPSTVNGGLSYAGGFFGAAGVNGELLRPPIRRPSLTPISERSESSYRNSLVFPIPGSQGGWGSPGPLSPGSWVPEQGEELTLGQLLQMRKNWGGSNASLKSTAGSPGNASPVGSPIGSPLGWSGGSAALAAVGMGTPSRFSGDQGSLIMDQQQQQQQQQQQYQYGMPSPQIQSAPQSIGLTSLMGADYAAPTNSANGNILAQHVISPLPPFYSSSPPGLSPPPPPGFGGGSGGMSASPPGLGTTPPPPGLHHAGANAMLPTKASFEDPLQQAVLRAQLEQNYQVR